MKLHCFARQLLAVSNKLPRPTSANLPCHSSAHFYCSSTMSSKKFQIADKLKGCEKNVWIQFTELARTTGALNLGQGFPDFSCPEYIKEMLCRATTHENHLLNQYTRGFGHPRLVNAISKLFSPLMGHDIDALKEVLITAGAYEALHCCIHGLLNPGDEVIIIEPFFDCYQPMVKMAHGVPVFIPLRPTENGTANSSSSWKLDPEELASKFNSKTKLIILNTPNNPLGKVFKREELEVIADLCKKHDVVCISDEVYEWLVYEGNQHVRIASLPGMWERTITVGSAGKTFGITGWKTGWCIGPAHLLLGANIAHQNIIYTCPTVLQEAIAEAFELETKRIDSPECYFRSLPADLEKKRDDLAAFLEKVGMVPIIPEGGYFMMADVSKLGITPEDDGSGDPPDFQFVKWLCKEKKLATIPPSAFYGDEHKPLAYNYVRFCFCKKDSTLDEAARILTEWKNSL